MAKFYLVGGAVRDKLLGLNPKDLDYCVVAESYDAMKQAIADRGGTIFLETPEYFTIRAKIPELGAADFVLARKEANYSDGRRPDTVEVGTLQDDLARRDFTVNAIAMDEDGSIIDPFGGQADLVDGLLRSVGLAEDRFSEDFLRLLRACRFHITKCLRLDRNIEHCLNSYAMISGLKNVSTDRIREELHKMFKFNTLATLCLFGRFPLLKTIFTIPGANLWLKPTTEQ